MLSYAASQDLLCRRTWPVSDVVCLSQELLHKLPMFVSACSSNEQCRALVRRLSDAAVQAHVAGVKFCVPFSGTTAQTANVC